MNEEYDEDFIRILTIVFSASGYCQVELDLSFEKINVNSRAIFSWNHLCCKIELRTIKIAEPPQRYKYPNMTQLLNLY